MTSPSPIITLLTDFGTADGYVAELKGVLCSNAPHARLVDASHDVPAQDIESARLALARYWRRYPLGTVHVVVVDPGVGSDRAAIAVASGGHFFVGPDNGVLSPALLALDARTVQLPIPIGTSFTFHGRDVFAPAAARLATGTPLDELGDVWLKAERRRTPETVRRADGGIAGVILTIDRFGNAITNLIARTGGVVSVAGHMLPLVNTYAEGIASEALALVASNGLVEIAVRNGSARDVLRLERGDEVVLYKH